MKLSKLYSNDERFRTITFNDGLNVILGHLENESDLGTNSHNLGKSKLIELIDFMLLKKIDKSHFLLVNKDLFVNHVFYLEIVLRDSTYVTIKRNIKNHTKVSLKIHKEKHQDFREFTLWDYEEISINSKNNDANPYYILNSLWGFNKLFNYKYRDYINYFLRTQYDYDEVFKLSKYQGGDKLWKPQMAALLGYNGDLIKYKYELETNIIKEKELLENMEKEMNVSISDLNRLQSLIDITLEKRNHIQDMVDNFDFFFNERAFNKELVEEIEVRISELNQMEYKLKYEIEEIRKALNDKNSINLDKIERLFNEVKIEFPDKLMHDYQDLINFNNLLSAGRKKYLKINYDNFSRQLTEILQELSILNKRRNEALVGLKETDTFTKFKIHQNQLVSVDSELNNLMNKLDNYETLKIIQTRITELKVEVTNVAIAIKIHLEEDNSLFKLIQKSFSTLADQILNETAIIFHKFNANGNVEFQVSVTESENNDSTSRSDGFSYKKLLCVCFDLALLLNYDQPEFYRFVCHDGPMESISNTKSTTYLSTVKNICSNNNIQYILTTLEDHLPIINGNRYLFKSEEVILSLSNKSDNSERLFGFSF